MGKFYESLQDQLEALDEGYLLDYSDAPILNYERKGGTFGYEDCFGVDYTHDVTVIKGVQDALNTQGFGPLTVDGSYGPKSKAAVQTFQRGHGLGPDGVVGDATLAALGLKSMQTKGPGALSKIESAFKPGPASAAQPGTPVKIATVIAALRQAGKEKGYDLSDQLLSLMIGQLRGAEGAYPGVKSSLGGTNNMGAAQVDKSLASLKKGLAGWGAFAHRDSDPNKGAYIGWYWIAPSPLEAARHWFGDNWWGPALAKGNPQNPTDYAAILYRQGYFGGMHAGDTKHDPTSPAGQLNVADYAAAMSRGVASAAELADTPDDPSKSTVDPSQFATLDARKLTQDLYDKAKTGGIGSAWAYLLPVTWAAFVKNNGVVWFGPVPGKKKSKVGWIVAGVAAVGGVTALVMGGRKS